MKKMTLRRQEQESRQIIYTKVWISRSAPPYQLFFLQYQASPTHYNNSAYSQPILSGKYIHYLLPNVITTCLRIGEHNLSKRLVKQASKDQYSQVSYLSGTRGAKQDVVEWMHRIWSGSSSWTLASTAFRSVRSSSPSKTFSITTGSKPNQVNQKSKH